MKLSDLLSAVPDVTSLAVANPDISSITQDSRLVTPGVLFVARSGGTYDGHDFIKTAFERGASAVVGERLRDEFTQDVLDPDSPYVRVPCAASALAWLAAALNGFPAHKLVMIGVTGTDGKTTTCNVIHNILRAEGIRSGMISTVDVVIGEEVLETGLHVTTPDALTVQGYLGRMVEAGLTHCVLEATSHGLYQHRVTACDFDLAIVTNITHEHIDFHGSLDAYIASKATLFESLATAVTKPGIQKLAVLNRDDAYYSLLLDHLQVPFCSYGTHPESNLRAEDLECASTETHFNACAQDVEFPVESSLIGDFNVLNCLAAISCSLWGLNIRPEVIQRGIKSMPAIPGRMERIDLGQDFVAMVDFAHTPNSLRRALQTARQMTSGRVIVVFGSAGLRDVSKRRLMGEVAGEWADYIVITAEDPRTESLESIMSESVAGCISAGAIQGKGLWRVPDRSAAIHFAVSLADTGDVVMACGKAHERSMCFEEVEYPWDEILAMRAAVARRLGHPEPLVPKLPTDGQGVLN